MKKILTIVLMLLCFVSKAQTKSKPKQSNEVNTTYYDMFKETVTAEKIFFDAFTHADMYARGIYMKDANDCANRAETYFLKLESELAKRLTKQEFDDLKGWIGMLQRETGKNAEDVGDNTPATFAVVSTIMDVRLAKMAPKILR
jgi:hypothetical protein